jgi:hypothetical protein
MAKRHLSFIPIPALTVIIAALYLFVKPSLFYEPSWLVSYAGDRRDSESYKESI